MSGVRMLHFSNDWWKSLKSTNNILGFNALDRSTHGNKPKGVCPEYLSSQEPHLIVWVDHMEVEMFYAVERRPVEANPDKCNNKTTGDDFAVLLKIK